MPASVPKKSYDHVVHAYFIFVGDGQCDSGTTVLVPPHLAIQLETVYQGYCIKHSFEENIILYRY